MGEAWGEARGSLLGRSEAQCLELSRGAFGICEKILELPMVTKTWNPNRLRQKEPEFQVNMGHMGRKDDL